jgi:hypothetical protein
MRLSPGSAGPGRISDRSLEGGAGCDHHRQGDRQRIHSPGRGDHCTRSVQAFEKSERPAFFIGYTYSGNPLSCAAGLAVLGYIEKNRLVERSAQMGKYLFERLARLKELPMVGDIRGKGLLLGIEFVKDKAKKTPFERS